MMKKLFALLLMLMFCVGLATVAYAGKLTPQYITLNLESPRGLKTTIEANINGTVADLKAVVAEKCGVTFGEGSPYRLFGADLAYPNSKLDDDSKFLKDIGFAAGQTIHLEKSTNWDASGNEPIKIFGLTITGGKGSQEPYGDYNNVDYYWNYYYKTITIKSTAAITISGTGEPNTNIIIKKAGSGQYTNLTISDLHLTTDAGACINVQGNSWVKLTVKGNSTLTATGQAAQYIVDKMPALTLTNSGAYLKIMKASTGILTATTQIDGQPGIGTCDNTSSVWGVEINGGTIIANGGEGAAGIRAQAVCIYGGNVTANGGIDGYGTNALYPHSIEILGGTVVASNNESGKAVTSAPNLDSYVYYKATASTNSDGSGADTYNSASVGTYKYFKIEPAEVYAVSVVNGTSDAAKYVEGAVVTINANAPEEDKQFAGWTTTDGVTFMDANALTTTFTMPAKAVTVTANYEDIPKYEINVSASTGGQVSTSAISAAEGESVNVTATPSNGYMLKSLTVAGQDVTAQVDGDGKYTFTMPASNVEIVVAFDEIPQTTYTVIVTVEGSGTATASPTSGFTGTEVTLSATPDGGYQFKEWQVISGSVSIADNKFKIGTANVEIKAVFEAIPQITDPASDTTVTVIEGEKATLTITAQNAAKYQWYIDYNDDAGWKPCGDGTATYVSAPTKLSNNGYRYYCEVTSTTGETAKSPIFTLVVVTPVALPETGDHTQLGAWLAMLALCGAGMIALRSRKHRTE